MKCDGRDAFVSTRLLAEETLLARETVQVALRGLCQDGWLLKVDTGRRGKYGKPIYEYRGQLPNGPVARPLPAKDNGPVARPLPAKDNGLDQASQWTRSGVSMAQTEPFNGLAGGPQLDELAITSYGPPRPALEGAARVPTGRRTAEKIAAISARFAAERSQEVLREEVAA
jgi:hypothetical protein